MFSCVADRVGLKEKGMQVVTARAGEILGREGQKGVAEVSWEDGF